MTILKLLSDLREAEGEEIAVLSKKFEKNLEKDSKIVKGIFYSVFNRVLLTNAVPELSKIVESGFFDARVVTYKDFDSGVRVAVGLSFLQDYEDFIPDLDDQVAAAIVGELEKNNLQLVFNDICVNSIQYRNGDRC